jgi:regulator of extracellular matrix RemA (YlzA/DUF370 family)
MEYDTASRLAKVLSMSGNAQPRAAASLGPAADRPLDEKITRMEKLCIATVCLVRSESPESVVHRFTIDNGQKDKLLSIGLYQRERDVILRNPEQVMLVAIDPKDRVVRFLDRKGKPITLTEGGESVHISGKYRLYLERIETGLFIPQATGTAPGKEDVSD